MFSFLRSSSLLFLVLFTNLSHSAGGPDPWQMTSNNAVFDFNNYTQMSYVGDWISTSRIRVIYGGLDGYFGYRIINTTNYGQKDGYTIFNTGIPGVGAVYEVAFIQKDGSLFPPGFIKMNLSVGTGNITVGRYNNNLDVIAKARLVAIPGEATRPSTTFYNSVTAPVHAWESNNEGVVNRVATLEFFLNQTQVIVPTCIINATRYNISFGDVQSYNIVNGGVKSGKISVELDCSKVPNVTPKFVVKAISSRVDNSSIYPDERSDPRVADVKFTLFVEDNPVDLNNTYSWTTVSANKKYTTNFSSLVSSLPGVRSVIPGSITGRYELQTIYP